MGMGLKVIDMNLYPTAVSDPVEQILHSHILATNAWAWDERARTGKKHTRTVLPKDLRNPLPILDPEGWFEGSVMGKKVLCLAAGGGLQSALFAAAGAKVTVVDISGEMLELDGQTAARHGLKVTLVQASMDHLPTLPDGGFEIVLQPVSTCYVPDIGAVYREVARVSAPGGIYVSQHKQPASLQAGALPNGEFYSIGSPYQRRTPLPPIDYDTEHREAGTFEFIHTWEQILGLLCRSGFVIEDLREPDLAKPTAKLGEFGHRCGYLPPYVKLKARRRDRLAQAAEPIVCGLTLC